MAYSIDSSASLGNSYLSSYPKIVTMILNPTTSYQNHFEQEIYQRTDRLSPMDAKLKLLVLMLIVFSLVVASNSVKLSMCSPVLTIEIYPKFYDGGSEIVTFMITNGGSLAAIVKVMMVFPFVQNGDTDYQPTDYTVVAPRPVNWSVIYEVGIRQVTFEAETEADGINQNESFNFTIGFRDGPKNEGKYVWIVSMTDNQRQAYTSYPYQIIDRTAPMVTIVQPADGSIVDGIIVNATHHYMWVYVAAYDVPLGGSPTGSGIAKVEIQIDSGPWINITNYNPSTERYEYQYWNLDEGVHTITARATDGADNGNLAEHGFNEQTVPEFALPILLPLLTAIALLSFALSRRNQSTSTL